VVHGLFCACLDDPELSSCHVAPRCKPSASAPCMHLAPGLRREANWVPRMGISEALWRGRATCTPERPLILAGSSAERRLHPGTAQKAREQWDFCKRTKHRRQARRGQTASGALHGAVSAPGLPATALAFLISASKKKERKKKCLQRICFAAGYVIFTRCYSYRYHHKIKLEPGGRNGSVRSNYLKEQVVYPSPPPPVSPATGLPRLPARELGLLFAATAAPASRVEVPCRGETTDGPRRRLPRPAATPRPGHLRALRSRRAPRHVESPGEKRDGSLNRAPRSARLLVLCLCQLPVHFFLPSPAGSFGASPPTRHPQGIQAALNLSGVGAQRRQKPRGFPRLCSELIFDAPPGLSISFCFFLFPVL
ncbi:LOW QUALITY PROTEIN: uncharacterized protein LOC112549942, partial [Alligator sinensis]|uniref:LOW QUALITY PROTEIN: uncharacterized protein LOC112549942 n=1 Tax=Alligator sinensis TaxID=38654 RepID=A0A3Q0GH84_ALLSI